MPGKVPVLVAAGGAGWEAHAIEQLAAGAPSVVLLKRCVDLNDLLATATTGQAGVALVAHGLPGLDADSVSILRRAGLGVVMVAAPADLTPEDEQRTRRLGIEHLVLSDSMGTLNDVVLAAGADAVPVPARTDAMPDSHDPTGQSHGRLVAVWGPTGSPGRTTVSVGLAAELAHRGHEALSLIHISEPTRPY